MPAARVRPPQPRSPFRLRPDLHRSAGNYGLISTAVPSATSPQISSISASVTAMQPCVQSDSGCATPAFTPWIMMSPPGSTPERPRALHVRRVRVRDVQRQMVFALRIPPVDRVPSLGRPPVALAFLAAPPVRTRAPPGMSAQPTPRKQQHLAPSLVHHHPIHPQNPAPPRHFRSIASFKINHLPTLNLRSKYL